MSARYKNRTRQKQLDADARQAESDSLSVAEKIVKASKRRGESKREIARLSKQSLDNVVPKVVKKK